MRRKYISQLWKCFLAAVVFLCFVGCGRQESTIPSGASEGINAESSEGSMQGEKQQENKEQSAERQPDDVGLSKDRQPEKEAIFSTERTTATFDAGYFGK